MPRKPKHGHPIRQLRNIIGVSQRDFARLLGLSSSALQRIELGSLKLSERVAYQIAAVTGANPRTLSTSLKSHSGGPYRKEHYEAIAATTLSRAAQHQSIYMAKELGHRITLLLTAAQQWRRLQPVLSDLWDSIEKIRARYALSTLTNELLRKDPNRPRQKWRDVAPPGKLVFFDDNGFKVFSLRDKMQSLCEQLSIALDSVAYMSDSTAMIEVRRKKKQAIPAQSGAIKRPSRRSSRARKRRA